MLKVGEEYISGDILRHNMFPQCQHFRLCVGFLTILMYLISVWCPSAAAWLSSKPARELTASSLPHHRHFHHPSYPRATTG